MAAECASHHRKTLKMYGFSILGQGFYSMEILDKGTQSKFSGIISVQEGMVTEEKLEEELKILVNANWNFQVRQISRDEYRAAFPDQATLDTFSKLSEFVLAIHGLKVRISKSNIDTAASSVLQSVWIKVCGVPNFAREDEIIKKNCFSSG